MKCPYCGNTVIVPETLRIPAAPQFGQVPAGIDSNAWREEMAEVVALTRDGKKIEAIKRFRELTGVGLKEAKDVVDAIDRGEFVRLGSSAEAGRASYQNGDAGEAVPATSGGGRKVMIGIGVLIACVVLGAAVPLLVGLFALGGGLAFLLPASRSVSTSPAADGILASTSEAVAAAAPTLVGYAQVLMAFGQEGSGPGFFDDPRSIAVDGNGQIYVADYADGRIQRFDPQGNFSQLINVGQKNPIRGLAISGEGKLYALYGGEAWVFDTQGGQPLGKFEYSGDHYFDDLAISADGKLAFVSNGEDILVFNPDGSLAFSVPAAISTVSGDSELDGRIAMDGLGNIYLLGTFNNAVFKFSPDGRYLNKFGGEGDGPGKFLAPLAIAVDGQGRIYVSDSGTGIQVFDQDGAYLGSFSNLSENGVVFGMAFNPQNNLVAASNKPRVTAFDIREP
jgi:DNA-binding beta-propeller fold protein YncE